MSLAYHLVTLGAKSVIGLDLRHSQVKPHVPQVTFIQAPFEAWSLDVPLVFVSWPSNCYDEHLLRIVRKTPRVIYLGSNLEGTACGNPVLFKHFCSREVLAHAPDPSNSLIVYGDSLSKPRRHLPEEFAGIQQNTIWYYGELAGRPLPYASY